MDQIERLHYLIDALIKDMPEQRSFVKRFDNSYPSLRLCLRGLMNLRDPLPLDSNFLKVQDEFLLEERETRNIIDMLSLPITKYSKIGLFQGDITCLRGDCIVNAANSTMLGCRVPGHNCVDNAIHSYAGLELRDECYKIIKTRGHELDPGEAILTKGYNLPAKYVIHVLAPVVSYRPTKLDETELISCYIKALDIAEDNGLKTIVFPCVGTGVFGYPSTEAAKVVIKAVLKHFAKPVVHPVVIFCTYLDKDYAIYKSFLE